MQLPAGRARAAPRIGRVAVACTAIACLIVSQRNVHAQDATKPNAIKLSDVTVQKTPSAPTAKVVEKPTAKADAKPKIANRSKPVTAPTIAPTP